MADDERDTGTERSIPPRDIDPDGSSAGVDDHLVTPHPTGIGHQPTGGLDRGVDPENLRSESQGVKVEDAPDPGREAPPPD
jgi:hypothetical protein